MTTYGTRMSRTWRFTLRPSWLASSYLSYFQPLLYESAHTKKMDHREMEMALQNIEVSPSSKAWFWCSGDEHSFGKWMLVDIFLGFLVPGVKPKTQIKQNYPPEV